MTKALARPLSGLYVGLSVSESDDSAGRGFPAWQVDHVTVQVAAALMGQGAGVVFGHDWREDGLMEAIHTYALRMQAPGGMARGAPASRPLLQNLLPWPDEPKLSVRERDMLASTLVIETAGLPADVAQKAVLPLSEPDRAYVRARGLTHLRRELTSRTEARICVGGRTGGAQGRYPGVVEEAYLSVEARQPLFLIGLLGGATRQVIDALEGRPKPPLFGVGPVTDLYAPFAAGRPRDDDLEVDPSHVWSQFKKLGLGGLSRQNRLTVDENRELFQTTSIERAIHLTLRGLARIVPPPRPSRRTIARKRARSRQL
jgi:hypothetical protein